MVNNNKLSIEVDFLSQEENEIVERYLDKVSIPSPVCASHRCALGYRNYRVASRINEDNPAARLTSNKEDNKAIYLITEIYKRARSLLEAAYSAELALVQASYTEYSTGPGQRLHSDMYTADGDIRDDDISIVMEYSAVLYLTTGGGVDFSGGDLWFPKQELRHTPRRGSLIYFKGDMDHMHEVEDIASGVRKGLTLFYGYKEKVLENMA